MNRSLPSSWQPAPLLCAALLLLPERGGGGPPPAADCNMNGIDDREEIASDPAADCNLDGVLDACQVTPEDHFAPVRTFPAGALPHVIEAADVDGDSDLDLFTSDRAADTLSFLENDGSGGFTLRAALEVRDEPRGIDAGDVDGDGDLDIVCGSGNEDKIGELPADSVLHNRGDGSFAPRRDYTASPFEAGALRSVHLVDLDADGDPDLANGFSDGAVITSLLNDGRGLFSPPAVITAADPGFAELSSAKYIALGPIDADVLPDIVTFSGQLLRNRGGGRFAGPVTFAAVADPRNLTLADMDADGDLDAAILQATTVDGGPGGEVVLFLNDSGLLLPGPPPVLLRGQIQEGLAAGDLDGDGDADLAATFTSSFATLLLNDASGAYTSLPAFFPLGGGVPRWALAADLNGDGKLDLSFPMSAGSVSVLLNQRSLDDDASGVPDECESPFFRGDPADDGTVNLTDPVFLLNHLFRGGPRPACRESADANDDGALDLTDPVSLLLYLFRGGPPPPPPGPPDARCPEGTGVPPFLGCQRYGSCP